MKKIISVLVSIFMISAFVTGCSTNNESDHKLSIVTTIFPEYDWVTEILGDKADDAEVTMLLEGGVDMHSYQPSAEDLLKISDCDMFVYVGGESDGWVEKALANTSGKDITVVNLLEVLGEDIVKEEELVEGMEHQHEHDEEEHEEEHEHEVDEHVWLSLKNAKIVCQHLADKLSEIDPENKTVYEKNVSDYIKKLDTLDVKYQEMADIADIKTMVFADRFPFRYLADDYGLEYYAAFTGCSAETEASFETVAFLAERVNELEIPAVLTIESSDGKIAGTVIETANNPYIKRLILDSMQSVTMSDIENGADYLSAMEGNLVVLTEALTKGGL